MRQAAHWERRIPIYLIGMFLMTIGVNLSVLSGLGVSPIDTIPYILSLILQKSLGLCSTLVFSVYIVLHIRYPNRFTARRSGVSGQIPVYAVQYPVSRYRYFSVCCHRYPVHAGRRCSSCPGRGHRQTHVHL